jgi:hypothetical protein
LQYLVGGVELVVHESGDDAGLSDGLVAEEHQLVLGQRRHHRHRARPGNGPGPRSIDSGDRGARTRDPALLVGARRRRKQRPPRRAHVGAPRDVAGERGEEEAFPPVAAALAGFQPKVGLGWIKQ